MSDSRAVKISLRQATVLEGYFAESAPKQYNALVVRT